MHRSLYQNKIGYGLIFHYSDPQINHETLHLKCPFFVQFTVTSFSVSENVVAIISFTHVNKKEVGNKVSNRIQKYSRNEGNGKVHTIWGWGVSVTPRPLFTPGKDPVPIVRKAGWTPGPVLTGAENLTPTGIPSPARPVRSQSLYRLCYPAHILAPYVLQRIQVKSHFAAESRLVWRAIEPSWDLWPDLVN